MRLSAEEALILVAHWPEELTGHETLQLLRQLSSLDLPDKYVRDWIKDSETTPRRV